MLPIPNTPDDVSAAWLSAVMQDSGAIACTITEIDVSPLGVGLGTLSSMLRCRPTYDKPRGDEPETVVVKLEPATDAYRESVNTSHGFEREINFYREIAPDAPIRIPTFYFGAFDGRAGAIVLEDLGHLETRNQVHGLGNDEVIGAAGHIARLHAKYLGRDLSSAHRWMPTHDDRYLGSFTKGWDLFEEVYGLRIGADAVALGRRLNDNIDWLAAEMASRPQTICHGDFRADNLLFGEGPHDVTVIDWQLTQQSLATLDLTRLLGGSEPSPERRSHPMEAFDAWHAALLQEGVAGYPRDDALGDFRLGMLAAVCVPVRLIKAWGVDPGGRQGQLLDAIATRMFAAAVDIDAGARLPR
ncbi:MAG: phosphotransferase [Pseudomonadota bacterium]